MRKYGKKAFQFTNEANYFKCKKLILQYVACLLFNRFSTLPAAEVAPDGFNPKKRPEKNYEETSDKFSERQLSSKMNSRVN